MRYPAEHKAETRAKVLAAASRSFRRHGREGIGVDGLAKAAGVTSGAFYSHFDSKDAAFESAVVMGMEELLAGIRGFREKHGDEWFEAFIGWYLGKSHRKDLSCGCSLVTLTPEVVRAGKGVKSAFSGVFAPVVDEIADGLRRGTAEERKNTARLILSTLAGSVTIARAMSDESAAEEFAAAALDGLRKIVGE
jgi:AcrR family transcriptional regulator